MPIKCLPFQSILTFKRRTGIDLANVILMMTDTCHFKFKQGTLLKLATDDSTCAPEFSDINGNGRPEWVNLDRLTIFDPEDPDHIIMRAKARLKGVD